MDIGHRQMGILELAARALQRWFQNFVPLLVISLAFTVPIYVITSAIATRLPETAEDLASADVGTVILTALAGVGLSILLSTLLTAGLTHAFIRIFRGESVAPGASIRAVLDNIMPLVVFGLITGFLTALGFIFLVIPAFLAIIIFSVGIPALLNERLSGAGAVVRCFKLLTGNVGMIFGVIVLGLVITIAASYLLGGVTSPGSVGGTTGFSDTNIVRIALQIAASALLAPLLPGLATALYFEVRGRSEGFPSLHEGLPSDDDGLAAL